MKSLYHHIKAIASGALGLTAGMFLLTEWQLATTHSRGEIIQSSTPLEDTEYYSSPESPYLSTDSRGPVSDDSMPATEGYRQAPGGESHQQNDAAPSAPSSDKEQMVLAREEMEGQEERTFPVGPNAIGGRVGPTNDCECGGAEVSDRAPTGSTWDWGNSLFVLLTICVFEPFAAEYVQPFIRRKS